MALGQNDPPQQPGTGGQAGIGSTVAPDTGIDDKSRPAEAGQGTIEAVTTAVIYHSAGFPDGCYRRIYRLGLDPDLARLEPDLVRKWGRALGLADPGKILSKEEFVAALNHALGDKDFFKRAIREFPNATQLPPPNAKKALTSLQLKFANRLTLDGIFGRACTDFGDDARLDLDEIREALEYKPPRATYTYSLYGRAARDTSGLARASYLYSFSPLSLDFAASVLTAEGHTGIGASVKHELTRYRLAQALEVVHSQTGRNDAPGLLKQLGWVDEAAEAYIATALSLRASAFLGYHHISGFGNITNPGIALSWLIPFETGKPSWGFSVGGNAQAIVVEPEQGRKLTSSRYTMTFSVQNRMPYYDHQAGRYQLLRWKYRFGFEYRFENSLDGLGAVSFFVRDRVSYKLEVIGSLGQTGQHKNYVALQVSYTP